MYVQVLLVDVVFLHTTVALSLDIVKLLLAEPSLVEFLPDSIEIRGLPLIDTEPVVE